MKQLLLLIVLCAGLLSVAGFAQSKLITGKVINDKGDPVPFATVKIKNSKVGTASDAQGVFTIRASGNDVLVISSTGFTSKEISVGTENNITVSLAQVTQELTSVVVTTALGIQRQAKDLGYSTTTITNK
ncbi:MAG TPA: carboxypeptidase-like regulatory domain-containing protein, partial [Chitinophagaceae bacterium]